MHGTRPRVAHHSHHSSLSHFEDIKSLQAELAKQDSLDAPPRTISSAQSTPQVAPKQPLATIASRPHSSARFVPTTWNPVFLDKPKQYARWLIVHPSEFPVCTLHLAAITIQRWWRRLGRIRRTKRSRRRIEHVPTWQHPWQRLCQTVNARRNEEHAAALITVGNTSSRLQLMQHAVSFDDYCASVIQRAWRASRERRHRQYLRRPMYRIAATSIQRWWKDRMVALGIKRSRRELAAITIQRAYRGYADRKNLSLLPTAPPITPERRPRPPTTHTASQGRDARRRRFRAVRATAAGRYDIPTAGVLQSVHYTARAGYQQLRTTGLRTRRQATPRSEEKSTSGGSSAARGR